MARYFCYNCDNLPFKQTKSVLEHIWGKHGVEVTIHPKESGLSCETFTCAEDGYKTHNIRSFLNHVDKAHGIHVWFEKGLTKKTVFFDGTLDMPSAKIATNDQAVHEYSERHVPLSKRPFEPRGKGENEENI